MLFVKIQPKPYFIRLTLLLVALLLVSLGRAAAPPAAAALPADAQAAISAIMGRDLAAYHWQAAGAGYRADNPAHGLAFTVDAAGLDMRRAGQSWSLRLTGLGYGDALPPLPAGRLSAAANRLEERRAPGLVEWYLNGPFGLEHGFDLAAPPADRAAGRPLTLALTQSDPAATLTADRRGLALAGGLTYAGLAAFDAAGRPLRAWLELDGRRLLARVDDAGARYPLRIDPWLQAAKLTAGDKAANDLFGVSVALSGDVAVVGAQSASPGGTTNAGAAYVFVKPAGGWTDMTAHTAKLTAGDKAAYDDFGYSVALSGDVAVVGARYAAPGGTSEAGAAYVFVKPAGGWAGDLTQTAKLTAGDKATGDWFGTSVALSGDVAMVGAPDASADGTSDAGAAYVFVKPAGGWADMTAQTAKLTAGDKMMFDNFGASVALSGDVAMVGAMFAAPDGTTNAGAAYVFVKPAGGWTDMTAHTAKLTAGDKAAYDDFGISVALSGDVAVVGARYASPGGTSNAGAAYVFVKPAGGWAGDLTQTAKLTAGDKATGDWFGTSVALSGDVAMVGAPNASPDGTSNAGAAYVFVKPAGGWADMTAQTAKLTAGDKAAGDVFGKSVALSGDVAVVGALGADLGASYTNAGAAYVFNLTNLFLPIIIK